MAKSLQDDLRQRRKDLDKTFKEPVNLKKLKRPEHGWIREVRLLLGMAPGDLAARLGVSRQAIQKLESSEINSTIAINTLSKVADAMDCEVVYALVPRTSLNKFLQKQAELVAEADGKADPKKLAKNLDPKLWKRHPSTPPGGEGL